MRFSNLLYVSLGLVCVPATAQMSSMTQGVSAETPEGMQWTLADQNDDGIPDLFLAPVQPGSTLGELWERGDTRGFIRTVAQHVVPTGTEAMRARWFDQDGDGAPDLYLTAGGTTHHYRNAGSGRFTLVEPIGGARAGRRQRARPS